MGLEINDELNVDIEELSETIKEQSEEHLYVNVAEVEGEGAEEVIDEAAVGGEGPP